MSTRFLNEPIDVVHQLLENSDHDISRSRTTAWAISASTSVGRLSKTLKR